MTTPKPAKKPAMQSLARLIAKPGRSPETVLALPSGALCLGDPWTSGAGRVELGVTRVSAFLLDVGFDEDQAAIVVRARPTVATQWEIGASGGVDSGVFAVWDADAPRTDDGGATREVCVGSCTLGGRPVFALETGDGGFPCVVGRDDEGQVCAVIAGPGVDPARFGAVLREDQMTDAERAEKAAQEAREAALGVTDRLGAKLGEERASPPLRWFVAGWLESLPAAERARVVEALDAVLEALALPSVAKKAKDRVKADTAAILAWAVSGWATVLSATMPAEAEMLAVTGSVDKKKMDWAGALGRVYDYKMSDRRFDLARPFEAQFTREEWEAWSQGGPEREAALATARRDLPADLSSRLGLSGLTTMADKIAPHDQLKTALWYASRGLETALELHVLATRTADLARVEGGAPEGGAPLRARDPGYVEALLAQVETPLDMLLRLARR